MRGRRNLALSSRWGLNQPTKLVMLAACMFVACLYLTNDDMGADPASPRGDGRYRPVLARGDGHMLYLMARSTALDLDWDFTNDLQRFGDPWHEPITPTGRKAIIHPIGPALVWTPLIWVAHGGAKVANAFGADIQEHGYTLWHQRFVFFSSVLFGCGAVLLGRRLAARVTGGAWSATYAAVAILLGTSLTYYSTNMPSYSHAMDAFACACFLLYWASTLGRRDLRRWIVLGLLLGVATLVRTQELALGIVVAVEVVHGCLRRSREDEASRAGSRWRWLAGGCATLAVAAVVLIPQLIEWHLVFGRVTELPQGPRYTRLEAPMILELLFSARNGWFASTPLAYAGCVGLFLVPREHRLVGAGLLLAVAVQVYLNSTILDWWGSASFGQRRLCNVTLPLVVGLAVLLWRVGRLIRRKSRVPAVVMHAAIALGLGPFIWWNVRRVVKLDGGKPAPQEMSPTCCDNVPRRVRPLARWIYARIGNPFQFPANAIFALGHGVSIQRWDQTVGHYPVAPGLGDVRGDRLYLVRGRWPVGSPFIQPFLLDGWSKPYQQGARQFRLTTRPAATVLVPNLMPYRQRYTLWIAPAGSREVVVEWEGDVVARQQLEDGWNEVTFELESPGLHTNELTIRAPLGWAVPTPPSIPLGVGTLVGVAVSDLEIRIVCSKQ